MATTYKGLTIRLGADASELKKALRASDSAINATQKQLRELAKAAKLDPANTKVFAEHMDVLGDKAVSLSAKLMELKKSDFMQHLATDTTDAALKAKLATAEYAKLCDQIKALKNQSAIDAGIDPFKKGQDPFKSIAEGSAAAVREIQRLGKIANKTQAEVNAEVRQYLDLVRRWKMADTANKIAKERAELDKFKTTLTVTEAEVRAVNAEMARLASANPAITQTAKFEKFRRNMDRAEESAKELRSEVSRLDKALELDPYSIDAARLKLSAMNEHVRLNVDAIEQMEKQLNSMRAKGLDKVAAKYTDLRQEIAKAEQAVEKWGTELDMARAKLANLDADTSVSRVSKEFKEATAEVAKFEKKLSSAQRHLNQVAGAREYVDIQTNMAATRAEALSVANAMRDAGDAAGVSRASLQQLGWSLYSTVTPAMMMFGYRAISAAEDVDAAYRNMRKTVEGSEAQFEELKQAAIDYSRTHVTDAATLLEIEALGGQLGVATDKLEGFATTISNLEIATNLDADTAAEQLGQLANILNDMTQDDFDNFGDALVRLGNNNATLEDKIMDVMLRIASMGTITGFTTTQLLSWSTAVAATGQGAESAGTAISNTFSDIETAVGKGGESLESFARVAGMSSSAFAKMWNETPSEALQAFVNGLREIEESGGSADSTLNNLGITGVRQKQAILGLVQTIDGLNANLKMSEEAWSNGGDAALEAERKAEGFSGAIQLLRNNLDALGVEMGDSITPALKALSDFVAGATQAYSNLPDILKWAVDLGLVAAAFSGPALVGWNAVTRAISDVGEGIVNGKKAMAQLGESGAALISTNEKVAKTLGITGSAADGTTKKWQDMNKAQKAATLGTKALHGALGAIPAVVGAIAVTKVVSELAEYIEYTKRAKTATDGLRSATLAARSGLADVDASAYVDSAKAVVESAKAMTEANAEFVDSLNKEWRGVNNDNALVDQYVKTIEELGGVSDLTATDQVRLNAAVKGLNDTCGTSYQIIDAANGVLSHNTDVIRENADAWMKSAKAQAAQQSVQDIMARIVETEGELAVVKAKRAEIDEQAAELLEYGAGAASYAAVEDAQLAKREEELTNQVDDLNFALRVHSDLAAGYIDQTETATESTNLFSEEVQALIDGLYDLSDDNSFFNDMLANSGMTIEELAVQMDNAGVSMDSLSQKMEDYAEKTANAFTKIEAVSGVTLNGMLETLEHNAEITRNWSSSIAELYAKAGNDSERAFIDYISSMGVEYAPVVEQLLKDSSGMLGELATAWEDSMSAGKEAALTETMLMVEDVNTELKEMVDSGYQSGYDYMAETARGIEDGTPLVVEAVQKALNSIGVNGPTQPSLVAGQSAASTATSGTNSVNNTSSVTYNLSVGGIDLSNNQNAMEAAWALFQELEWRADT